jgi:hypothetical protein
MPNENEADRGKSGLQPQKAKTKRKFSIRSRGFGRLRCPTQLNYD